MNDINVVLAERTGFGRIRLCECDAVHVSVGPVTLNMAPEAFAQMTELMRAALDRLSQITDAKAETVSTVDLLGPKRSLLTH